MLPWRDHNPHAHPEVDRWGNVPEWFAAVGTVGSLVVALVLLGLEFRSRRERERYERSKQARQVRHAPVASGGFSHTFADPYGEAIREIVVQNLSDDPIHDVMVVAAIVPEDAVSPDGGIPAVQRRNYTVIAPNGSTTWRTSIRVVWTPDGAPVDHELRISVEFTDSSDQRWVRDHEHRLRLLRKGKA